MRPAEFLRGVPAALTAALILFLTAAGARAQLPALGFKFEAYTAKESSPTAPITVVRLGGTNDAVSVDYATLNTAEAGTTASPDVDYTPVGGTLHFAPGVRTLTFAVPLRQDAEDELNEQVILVLSNAVNAALGGQASATLTITDDDLCAYTLTPTSRAFGPEGGSGEFTINVIAGCPWTVTKPASANWVGVFTASGSGASNITYSVDANPSTAPRSATLRVAGKSFALTQRGVPPPDLTRPVVTITAPAAGARITNLPFNVTGKASDAGGVDRVEFRVENGAGTNEFWTPADGTTNWSASVDGLRPGLNTVRVRAYDTSGNYASNGVARSFNFVVVSPLSLTTDGGGVVAGARDGQFLDVGKTYTVTATATPVKSNLFSHWSGDIVASTPRLVFVMRTNLALTAHFVPNPFLDYKGAHQGLVSQLGSNARHETSGFFSAAVTDLGAYSARITLGGKVIPISGRFALDNYATNIVPRPGLNPLTIFLTLNSGSVAGSISDGNWEAFIEADRILAGGLSDPSPVAGRYKLVFPGDSDAARAPHGFSFATATMDAAGRISLVATLAEGTVFSQGATLSLRRRWPLFGRLYGGAGQILGWMEMSSAEFPLVGLGGHGNWFKTPLPLTRYYTNGFWIPFEASAARHVPPLIQSPPFLRFTNGEFAYGSGQVVFSGGNVAQPFTNLVRVDPGNRIVGLGTTDQGTNRLTMTYTLSSGSFSGTVTVPGTTRSIPFKGSLYGGFFLGSNECGRVLLRAAP